MDHCTAMTINIWLHLFRNLSIGMLMEIKIQKVEETPKLMADVIPHMLSNNSKNKQSYIN